MKELYFILFVVMMVGLIIYTYRALFKNRPPAPDANPENEQSQHPKTYHHPTIQYDNGDYYIGEEQKGIPHGNGVMYYANGDTCSGQWIQGIVDGLGSYKRAYGTRFEGFYRNGYPQSGTMTYPNGDTFEGHWRNGKRWSGTYTWAKTTRVYQGEFKENKLGGQGKEYRNKKIYYSGDFENNNRNGYGVFFFDGGFNTMKGMYVDGKPTGVHDVIDRSRFAWYEETCTTAKYTYADGILRDFYIFSDEELEEMKYPDSPSLTYPAIEYEGGVYMGETTNTKPDGQGTFELPTGLRCKGSWRDGKPHGKVRIFYPDNSIYEGEVYEGVKSGTGKFILPNGDYWEGEYIDGLREGIHYFYPKGSGENHTEYQNYHQGEPID